MSMLKGAAVIGQSGGPSSVINASAYGAIKTALESDVITNVYAMQNGIVGLLNDNLFDLAKEDPDELALMKYTPSSALGSCRYKLKDPDEDETDYQKILAMFKKYDIRYFFYNGGNDSMDTCNKISKFMLRNGYEVRCMGIPKTIDNDLAGTDHCPGFASAAKYIATSVAEVYRDCHVYDKGMITIVECMGRHAGWLTAAAALENIPSLGEELFYCEGETEIAGVPITCVSAHGEQTFEQALANSCNCAFAKLAVRLGQDTMVDYVRQFGLLDAQTLDGIPTAKGNYPLEFVGDPEIGWSGIGQSTDLVCPYSMLRFVAAIANGGILLEPKLINDGKSPVAERYMNSDTANELKRMMNYTAVTSYDAEYNFPGLKICAKTGTAELGDGDSHSWFVGFLADDEHPYAFVTLVERGGYGITVAGAITNGFLQWAVENIE